MFIKKIFQNNADESVHRQFIRFGKGIFEKRAVINVKKSTNIEISTSSDFANDLVLFICDLAGNINAEGIVLSREQISEFNSKKKKELFSHDIKKKFNSDELKKIAGSSYASLLDCSAEGILLKIKKKLQKPSKKKEAKVDEKFCILSLDRKYFQKFHDEFLFDLANEFKKVHIEHKYIINEIIIPKEFEKEKDFEKVRQLAKKKGKLIRKIVVDGKESEKEIDFLA